DKVPEPDPSWSALDPSPESGAVPFRIYNIGNSKPVPLMRFIEVLETALGRSAQKRLLPMQPGDVATTWADIDDLQRAVGFAPKVSIEEGVPRFVHWYRAF